MVGAWRIIHKSWTTHFKSAFKIMYIEHVVYNHTLAVGFQPNIGFSVFFKYFLYAFIIVYKIFISQVNPKIKNLYGVLSLVPIAQERNLEPTNSFYCHNRALYYKLVLWFLDYVLFNWSRFRCFSSKVRIICMQTNSIEEKCLFF